MDNLRFDIVISGGSFSAPAAALSAARNNPSARILLIEPTDWLGGQATSQGVSAIDNAWFDPGRTVMLENPDRCYARDYLRFLRSLNDAGVPGTGLGPNGTSWVSREAFDPRSAAFVLDRHVAEHPNITVLKLTVVKEVEAVANADGSRTIRALTLIQRTPRDGYTPFDDFLSQEIGDWYSAEESARFTKKQIRIEPANGTLTVIDASELADVLVLSGARWIQGRELHTEELGADGSLPAMDDLGSQATVFVFCMTDAPAPSPESGPRGWWPDFDSYFAEESRRYFSLKQFTWQKVWTYRRLVNAGKLFDDDAVQHGDVSMQNWEPGNDYPYASPFTSRAETMAQAARGDWRGGISVPVLAACEKHAVAWYYWMKEHRPTSWDTLYLHGGHPLNMMGTRHGLAKFPYIRCGRHVVGPDGFRIVEKHWKNSQSLDFDGKPSHRFFDAVGIGSYAADVHATHTSKGIRPNFERPAPFYIPYRALVSDNVTNLLAAGKNMAQTYITNSAYRLHPIEWASGAAAGTAAALMARDGVGGRALLEKGRLRELQARVKENSPIGWEAWGDSEFPE